MAGGCAWSVEGGVGEDEERTMRGCVLRGAWKTDDRQPDKGIIRAMFGSLWARSLGTVRCMDGISPIVRNLQLFYGSRLMISVVLIGYRADPKQGY